MARASAGVTPACALAAEKRNAGSSASPPAKVLRVTVFMNGPFHFIGGEVPTRREEEPHAHCFIEPSRSMRPDFLRSAAGSTYRSARRTSDRTAAWSG